MHICLVLAGDPPSEKLLRASQAASELMVAVDGGVNCFQKFQLSAELVIGDLDSLKAPLTGAGKIIETPNQNQTDLQKALKYVIRKYAPTHIQLLGATGGRTDHLVNNLQICATLPPQLGLVIISEPQKHTVGKTEHIFRVTPLSNSDLKVKQGSTLSVFSVSDFAGLQSRGLKWDISNQSSSQRFFSQSNLANVDDPAFNLASGCVYISVYQ